MLTQLVHVSRLLRRDFSPSQLTGFNNTGNVCKSIIVALSPPLLYLSLFLSVSHSLSGPHARKVMTGTLASNSVQCILCVWEALVLDEVLSQHMTLFAYGLYISCPAVFLF